MVKEFLSQRSIEYVEKDVSQDEEAFAALEQLGFFSTPVTVINVEVVVGFDKKKLEALLA